jgi:hypothetical protein
MVGTMKPKPPPAAPLQRGAASRWRRVVPSVPEHSARYVMNAITGAILHLVEGRGQDKPASFPKERRGHAASRRK